MAVRIRLARHGRKKAPFYRIVAADGRMPRDGRYLERLGHFDPMVESGQLVLDLERVDYWSGVEGGGGGRGRTPRVPQGVMSGRVVDPIRPVSTWYRHLGACRPPVEWRGERIDRTRLRRQAGRSGSRR